ncbi:helix-turn-helix domain-containing protein [Arachidicoccus terrestris]|uniref:helix-turn-helix domain-containing protein n=1 Tax=Arachidicoccus terrestris TaxID=2875539 RepID=UPI001CC388F5|nr:AraC family transcriptional regulator [Arachidicoccus terrestris]UAY56929.1 helix-turn-helix transcriptional regulator [Arachidicoccus terrestris]
MANNNILRIKTISELHQLRGLPQPEHPLVSVVDYAAMKPGKSQWITLDFYSIAIKRGVGHLGYGQQQYDFNEGVMFFLAPSQVFRTFSDTIPSHERSGWILYFHPDFLWNTALAKNIHQYDFFDYAVNEALFLSSKEETVINGLIKNIQQEYHTNIDKFSQDIIVSQIETLLNYSKRFYERQFITRKISNHQILDRLAQLLEDYFENGKSVQEGLPSVQAIAEALNISPGYLSGLLRSLTGKSTQEHIHEKLIEKAKLKLSTTQLTVSEIAYELGFEHVQSFHKLFKTKTNQSPLQFRASFN